MPTDTTPAEQTGLIGYPEAARMLNLNIQAVRSLVIRGELHTQPGPGDKRRRFLSLPEVQQYAVKRLVRGAIRADTSASTPAPAPAATPGAGIDLSVSPQLLGAVAAGAALILLLIFVFKSGADATTRALIAGAIAGMAVLVITEWRQEGRITAQEELHLKTLASKAESEPEPFMSELERLLDAAA